MSKRHNSKKQPEKLPKSRPKKRSQKQNDAFVLYDLRVEVESDGVRPMVCNHPEGSYFILSGENLIIPERQSFPIYSLAALIPLLPVKQRETHRHDWISTDSRVACPDPNCGGVFLIKRIGKKIFHHHEVTLTPLRKEGM